MQRREGTHKEPGHVSRALATEGWSFLKKEKIQEALKKFSSALAAEDILPEVIQSAKLGIAKCYEKYKWFDEAITIYHNLEQTRPIVTSYYYCLCNYAWHLCSSNRSNRKKDKKAIMAKARDYFILVLEGNVLTNNRKVIKSIYLGLLECYQNLEEYDKGLMLLKKASQEFPKDPNILIAHGNFLKEIADYIGALNIFDDVYMESKSKILEPKTLIHLHISRMDTYLALENYKYALIESLLLEQHVKTDADKKFKLHIDRALCFEKLIQYPQALIEYQKAKLLLNETKNPRYQSTFLVNNARFLAVTGKPNDAIQLLKESKTPDSTNLLTQARIHEDQGDIKDAESNYNILRQRRPTGKKILMSLAHFYQDQLQDYDKALSLFDEIEILYPGDIKALLGKAFCLRLMRKHDDALTIYNNLSKRILDEKSVNPESTFAVEVILSNAEYLNETDQFDKALLLLETLPPNEAIDLAKGRYYKARGDYEKAIQLFSKYNSENAICSLGHTYMYLKRFEEALRIYYRSAHKNSPKILHAIALCYHDMNNLVAAETTLAFLKFSKASTLSLTYCYLDMHDYKNAYEKIALLEEKGYANTKEVILLWCHYYIEMNVHAPIPELFIKLQTKFKDDPKVLMFFAHYYQSIHAYDKAFSIYDKFKNKMSKQMRLDYACCLQKANRSEASQEFTELIKIYPNDFDVMLSYAIHCDNTGNRQLVNATFTPLKNSYNNARLHKSVITVNRENTDATTSSEAYIQNLINKNIHSKECYLLLAKHFFKTRQYENARQQYFYITRSFPYYIEGHIGMINCFLHQKQYHDASLYAWQFVQKYPYNTDLRLIYLNTLIASKNTAEAAAQIHQCSEMFPGHPTLPGAIAQLTKEYPELLLQQPEKNEVKRELKYPQNESKSAPFQKQEFPQEIKEISQRWLHHKIVGNANSNPFEINAQTAHEDKGHPTYNAFFERRRILEMLCCARQEDEPWARAYGRRVLEFSLMEGDPRAKKSLNHPKKEEAMAEYCDQYDRTFKLG